MMSSDHNDDSLLVGTDSDSLNQDCRLLREHSRTDLPSADEVIDFLDGYNAFINHASRPFRPMQEKLMLL